MSDEKPIPALQIIRADWADGWAVLLDEHIPGSDLPRVLLFPEYETARAFVEAVRGGKSPGEALQMLLTSKAH